VSIPEYSTIVEPAIVDVLSPVDISRVDVSTLCGLLSEFAQRDPSLRRRLRDVVSAAKRTDGVPNALPAPAAADPSFSTYMVGASPVLLRVFDAIRRYAISSAPVLVTGESGTGKELVARAIHERSSANTGPFVAINCGALPTTLIGSELFGYEKGAFTGAANRKIGRIESAAGGTVFLDEIGDLPFETQAHLLRFLQEGTIERIGGCKSITINARVIAATNVDLRKAVANHQFREDLFYRLHVLTLALPPLRERGDDIMLLARFFLQRFSEEIGREKLELSPEAAAFIMNYPWPGNIRELIASLRRAVVMEETSSIRIESLGLMPLTQEKETVSLSQDLNAARATAEAAVIRATLERNGFNVKQSAKEMGISRVTLYRNIEKYHITIDRPRAPHRV
jgi:transcriptional regulator with PAS, ATPase and Fis domain